MNIEQFWELVEGQSTYAHRVSYLALVGPIPGDLVIDHLCRNPKCVNPAHLEPVTRAENQRRDWEARGVYKYATHCKNGHEFTEANTIRNGNERTCRTCRTEYHRAYHQRRRGAA